MKVAHPARIIRTVAAFLSLLLLLAACSSSQPAKNTKADEVPLPSVSSAKQMNLVITGHSALNPDEHGAPASVVLRIYELKDSMAFEMATYADLLAGSSDAVRSDILAQTAVKLNPGSTVTVSGAMADEAQFVGVVAFFRNQADAEWQIVIPKTQWKKTDPVKLIVSDNRLELEVTR